ncbi:hypothetical protein QTP88_006870 [Uroleucon formosanum]
MVGGRIARGPPNQNVSGQRPRSRGSTPAPPPILSETIAPQPVHQYVCAAGGASFNDWPGRPTGRPTDDRPTDDRPTVRPDQSVPGALLSLGSPPCHLAAHNVSVPDGVVGRNAHHHHHGEDTNHRLRRRSSHILLYYLVTTYY